MTHEKKRETWIRRQIESAFEPLHFEILNDSRNHVNHLGQHDGLDHESHFKIVVVAEAFSGMSRVERQRWVYDLLKTEMSTGALHSISMRLLSPEEW